MDDMFKCENCGKLRPVAESGLTRDEVRICDHCGQKLEAAERAAKRTRRGLLAALAAIVAAPAAAAALFSHRAEPVDTVYIVPSGFYTDWHYISPENAAILRRRIVTTSRNAR